MNDHLSSTTPCLPRVRSFEFHDLPYTPYVINFMNTRLLEVGWTMNLFPLSFIRQLARFILNNIHSTSPSGSSLEFDQKFGSDSKFGKPARFCDGLAELLQECFERIEEVNPRNSRKTDKRCRRILDLCSGAGGPSFEAVKTLSRTSSNSSYPVHLTVSDLFPHPTHWKNHQVNTPSLKIDFESSSVDATNVNPNIAPHSVWTINGAFHHFSDDLAMKILKTAIENEDSCDGILIVELSEHRLLPTLLLVPVILVLGILLPFYVISPWSNIFSVSFPKNFLFFLQVLFFMPIFMFTITWDSIVSCMRTLTSQELLELAKKADVDGKMEWHAAVRDYIPGFGLLAPGMVYLRGVRKS